MSKKSIECSIGKDANSFKKLSVINKSFPKKFPDEVLFEIFLKMDVLEVFKLFCINKRIHKALTTTQGKFSHHGMLIWKNAIKTCFPEKLYPKSYCLELHKETYQKKEGEKKINFYFHFMNYSKFFLGNLNKENRKLFLKAGYLTSITHHDYTLDDDIQKIFKNLSIMDKVGNKLLDFILETGRQFLLNSIYSKYEKLYSTDKQIILTQQALLLNQGKKEVEKHIDDKMEIPFTTKINHGLIYDATMTGCYSDDILTLKKYYRIVEALAKSGKKEHIGAVFTKIDNLFFNFEYARTEMKHYFLFSVIRFNKVNLLEAALEKIGNINKVLFLWDTKGYPLPDYTFPLMIAIVFGRTEIVETLLENKKINVNQTTGNSITPLMTAAELGNFDIFQLLLEKEGIEPDKRDLNNQSVVSYAGVGRNIEILKKITQIEGFPDTEKDKAKNWLTLFKNEVSFLKYTIHHINFILNMDIKTLLFSSVKGIGICSGVRFENLKPKLVEQLNDLVKNNCLNLLDFYQFDPNYAVITWRNSPSYNYPPKDTIAGTLNELFKKINPSRLARAAVDLALCYKKINSSIISKVKSLFLENHKAFSNKKQALIMTLLEGIRTGKLTLSPNQMTFISEEKNKKNSNLKDVLDIFDTLEKELNFKVPAPDNEERSTLSPKN